MLPLAAGGDYQHVAARQVHRPVEIHRGREIVQITVGLPHFDNPVERPPGDAKLAPSDFGDIAQRLQARHIGSERGDEHSASGMLAHFVQQPSVNRAFGARCLRIEDIGGIAHQRQNPGIAQFGQFDLRGRLADHRLFIQLPVAGMENAAIGRIDQQCVAFGNRMGQRHIGDIEWPEREAVLRIDHVQFDLIAISGLSKLVPHQIRGERRGVKRHSQFHREIGHRTDVVFVSMRQHDAEQIVQSVLDELQIGEHQFGAGIFVAAETHAEVDHQPLAVTPVEIDVHADFARSAEREEEQFGFGREIFLHGATVPARSARMARPSRVSSASTASKISVR